MAGINYITPDGIVQGSVSGRNLITPDGIFQEVVPIYLTTGTPVVDGSDVTLPVTSNRAGGTLYMVTQLTSVGEDPDAAEMVAGQDGVGGTPADAQTIP